MTSPDVKKRTFTQEFSGLGFKTFGVIGVAIAFVRGLATTGLVKLIC